MAVEGICVGSVKDSFATECQIHNFFFLCYFLIVIGVSRLSWTRLQGSCSRKFQIPEVSSVTSCAIVCCIRGIFLRTKILSDPVVWAYLECQWLEHHHELQCLVDSGNPFSEIMRLLPWSGWILHVRFEMLGSKQSFCNTEPSQAGDSFTSSVSDNETLTPGFLRNLSQTKLETANLWNTVHVLSTFFLEFAFSK